MKTQPLNMSAVHFGKLHKKYPYTVSGLAKKMNEYAQKTGVRSRVPVEVFQKSLGIEEVIYLTHEYSDYVNVPYPISIAEQKKGAAKKPKGVTQVSFRVAYATGKEAKEIRRVNEAHAKAQALFNTHRNDKKLETDHWRKKNEWRNQHQLYGRMVEGLSVSS